RRARCIVLGDLSIELSVRTTELASMLEIGVRGEQVPSSPDDAFALGTNAADAEIEAGADILVLAGADESAAPDVLVSLLTGVEPVALLPRGGDAVDTPQWIRRAEALRDGRRRAAPLRNSPDELLAQLGSPVVAAAAGCALRAAARRTAVVLDGLPIVAGALLCDDIQYRARQWWQVADTSSERAHRRAVEQLQMKPILDLETGLGNGTAGILALAVLRAAAAVERDDD
ncbi:MAG TPA: nicotinate-nucleotide--dimethylbenzimidazole phosphoribosyltransferase, partial [Jatrophihabitans sp.]|nr:nicotinate-nucleotide--dimethylbenzimidazole phosphoribosyltransferase [Jatrophihabitans sp.]